MVHPEMSPILAICIPTFLRTDEVIMSLKKILECEDKRYVIRVSSNEVNSQLEEFCRNKSNIIYHHFDFNQGFNRNFLYLMKSVSENFGLIISDEDHFAPEDLKNLLDILELEESSNRVSYIRTDDDFTISSLGKMVGGDISSRVLLATNPLIPTYMSSFVYPTCHLSHEILDRSFENKELNYYPHLLLRNWLINEVSLQFRVLENIRVVRGLESEVRDAAVNYLELPGYINRINFVLAWSKIHLQMSRIRYLQMSYILYAQLSAGHAEALFILSFSKNGNLYISLGNPKKFSDKLLAKKSKVLSEFALIFSHIVRRIHVFCSHSKG